MKLSVIVCEGLRDRVVVSSLVEARGWQPVAQKIARERALFVNPPFRDRLGDRALLHRQSDDRYLAVMERSKDNQAEAIRLLVEHNRQSPSDPRGAVRWDRLVIITDTDALDHPDPADVERSSQQRIEHLLSHAGLMPPPSPLDGWQRAAIAVPATDPPETFTIEWRVHVLPAAGQPGCLETALLGALGAESHQRLVDHLRQAVEQARAIKPGVYLRHLSDREKATAGAVLSVLLPDQGHTPLEKKLKGVPWASFPAIVTALSGLQDL